MSYVKSVLINMVSPNMADYLLIKEAAEYLGTTPNTLRNYEIAGKLPTYRHPVNYYRMYKRSDLDSFLSNISIPTEPKVKDMSKIGKFNRIEEMEKRLDAQLKTIKKEKDDLKFMADTCDELKAISKTLNMIARKFEREHDNPQILYREQLHNTLADIQDDRNLSRKELSSEIGVSPQSLNHFLAPSHIDQPHGPI